MTNGTTIDTYEDFIRRPTPWGRGKQQVRGVDSMPVVAEELAGYFAGLKVEKLAGCWVGCIVSAVEEDKPTSGDIARALIVVAERLHGLKFPDQEVVMPEPKALASPMLPPMPKPPAHNGNSGAVPSPITPRQDLGGGFSRGIGPPPVEVKRVPEKYKEALAAALKLGPGEWMVWTAAPSNLKLKIVAKRWKTNTGVDFDIYPDAQQRMIVARAAVQGP